MRRVATITPGTAVLWLVVTTSAQAALFGLPSILPTREVPNIPVPRITVPDISTRIFPIGLPILNMAKALVKSTVNAVAPRGVCFGYLGCFSMSSPWHSLFRPLPTPHSPEQIQTRFYLYTRGAPDRWNVMTLPQVSVEGSDYDGSKTTFFITHGFTNSGNTSWLSEMKDAILEKFDCNVILVDWGKGASLFSYYQVASNTRVVGAEVARLVNYLIDHAGSDPSRLNLIGHSLGAQISSYVGKRIANVAQITALDPAQPAFEGFVKAVRLDKSDAKFVLVLHTSARPFIPFIGLGMIRNYGHVDFYLNGGWDQPGCIVPPKPKITSIRDLAKIPVEVIFNFIACPHGRAYDILTATLTSDNCTFWGHVTTTAENIASALTVGRLWHSVFPSNNCTASTCSPLGFDAINYPARGVFNVATTPSKPFCVPEPEVDAYMKQYRQPQNN